MDQRCIVEATAQQHRSRVLRYLMHMMVYKVPGEWIPPTTVSVHVYTMHRLEVDGVQPATVSHDFKALRCALLQVKWLPLGWEVSSALTVCQWSFAERGAKRLFALPPKRQRPLETSELWKLVNAIVGTPTPFRLACLLGYLLNYFALARRGAVRYVAWACVPGKQLFEPWSDVQFGLWSRGRCVHFTVKKDKNLPLGTERRLTLPDQIPMLADTGFQGVCWLVLTLMQLRTRDVGCVMGANQRLLAGYRSGQNPHQATFDDAEWTLSRNLVKEVLGEADIATTAFRRGYVWALYRHGVSRDKMGELGFWSHDSDSMDVYNGISSQERCEHVSHITKDDIVSY